MLKAYGVPKARRQMTGHQASRAAHVHATQTSQMTVKGIREGCLDLEGFESTGFSVVEPFVAGAQDGVSPSGQDPKQGVFAPACPETTRL